MTEEWLSEDDAEAICAQRELQGMIAETAGTLPHDHPQLSALLRCYMHAVRTTNMILGEIELVTQAILEEQVVYKPAAIRGKRNLQLLYGGQCQDVLDSVQVERKEA